MVERRKQTGINPFVRKWDLDEWSKEASERHKVLPTRVNWNGCVELVVPDTLRYIHTPNRAVTESDESVEWKAQFDQTFSHFLCWFSKRAVQAIASLCDWELLTRGDVTLYRIAASCFHSLQSLLILCPEDKHSMILDLISLKNERFSWLLRQGFAETCSQKSNQEQILASPAQPTFSSYLPVLEAWMFLLHSIARIECVKTIQSPPISGTRATGGLEWRPSDCRFGPASQW